MGFYLNSHSAYTLYKDEVYKPYFVDKSRMLEELFPLVKEGNSHICITRPRRFGKTIMANMIASFFDKSQDSRMLFDELEISRSEQYHQFLNKYRVIHIVFNELPDECQNYEQYISRVKALLTMDLKQAYPELDLSVVTTVWDMLRLVHAYRPEERFVFVLDEWDYMFHQSFATEENKKEYIQFLSNLLKDKSYVAMTYMTGILPIAKYSSGSELNMVMEYTLISQKKFSEYFGFSEEEVDGLYRRFCRRTADVKVTREELKEWYNGYQTRGGMRIYNPRSVVCALKNNQIGSYWTSAGPYDEINYYVKHNVAEVRNELALMVSGIPVKVKAQEYAANAMRLVTKDEIFSAMIVYGFLSYENNMASIPNKELMEKFNEMLMKEQSLGYVYQLAKHSEKMLQATLDGNTQEMERILEYAHNTESPLLNYNSEAELAALVNLIYLSARDSYRIEREDRAGKGYADFLFYPEDSSADCIILELKVGQTAEQALMQIKEKQYAQRFLPKLGEQKRYTGNIRAVGIAYDKNTKKHSCRIEMIRNIISTTPTC